MKLSWKISFYQKLTFIFVTEELLLNLYVNAFWHIHLQIWVDCVRVYNDCDEGKMFVISIDMIFMLHIFWVIELPTIPNGHYLDDNIVLNINIRLHNDKTLNASVIFTKKKYLPFLNIAGNLIYFHLLIDFMEIRHLNWNLKNCIAEYSYFVYNIVYSI